MSTLSKQKQPFELASDTSEQYRIPHPIIERKRTTKKRSKHVKRALSVDDDFEFDLDDVSEISEDDHEPQPSSWGSLLEDLSLDKRTLGWRIHDRTHIELGLDYEVDRKKKKKYKWEAYYFIPSSLRIKDRSYQGGEFYDDLKTYVRYRVAPVTFSTINYEPLRQAISVNSIEQALVEMRCIACTIRACSISTLRMFSESRSTDIEPWIENHSALLHQMINDVQVSVQTYRDIVMKIKTDSAETLKAMRWVDEDISKSVETFLANLSLTLEKRGASQFAKLAALGAIHESQYREQKNMRFVLSGKARTVDLERSEFIRRTRKRFTSSVLWLSLNKRKPRGWIKHFFYALAAGAAMTFAIAAAIYHGPITAEILSANAWGVAATIVAAYAVKDRIKATLQSGFTQVLSKYTADRNWIVSDPVRKRAVGSIKEQSRFLQRKQLPKFVKELRDKHREFSFERLGIPEDILVHQKSVTIRPEKGDGTSNRLGNITDILRMNIARWLDHADDEKVQVAFADPQDSHIYSASLRKPYNISVIYRLTENPAKDSDWIHMRVVINSRGILRMEANTR